MNGWEGDTAVVTGGAAGIGLGVARALGQCGMHVVLADIDAQALDAAVAGLRGAGVAADTVLVDVSDRASMALAARTVAERHGPPRVLVNNAGVAFHGTPLAQTSERDWQWVLGVNLMGVVHGVQSFLPLMQSRGGGGHIVNTASGSGFFVRAGRHQGPYSVSKFAVVAYSEALELELEGSGIGVSVLCPGAVDTRLHASGQRRPARFGGPLERPQEAFLQDIMAGGLSADAVGALVVHAIRHAQFYIFTHQGLRAPIEARHARILAAFDRMPA